MFAVAVCVVGCDSDASAGVDAAAPEDAGGAAHTDAAVQMDASGLDAGGGDADSAPDAAACIAAADGYLAIETSFDVWWQGNQLGLDPGRNRVSLYALARYTGEQAAGGEAVVELKPCGLRLPLITSELQCDAYVIGVPDETWDAPAIPRLVTSVAPSTFEVASELSVQLVSVMLHDLPLTVRNDDLEYLSDYEDGLCGFGRVPYGFRAVPVASAAFVDFEVPRADRITATVSAKIGGHAVFNERCDLEDGATSDPIALGLTATACEITASESIDRQPCAAGNVELLQGLLPSFRVLATGEAPGDSNPVGWPMGRDIDKTPSQGTRVTVVSIDGALGEPSCANVRSAVLPHL